MFNSLSSGQTTINSNYLIVEVSDYNDCDWYSADPAKLTVVFPYPHRNMPILDYISFMQLIHNQFPLSEVMRSQFKIVHGSCIVACDYIYSN